MSTSNDRIRAETIVDRLAQESAEGFTAEHRERAIEQCMAGMHGERKRVAAILGNRHAGDRKTLARHLALHTDIEADAAKSVLSNAPAERPAGAIAGESEFSKHMRTIGADADVNDFDA